MKIILKNVLLILIVSYSAYSQNKINLREIWGGAFRTKEMSELATMKNTNQYTVLNNENSFFQIDLYDFVTSKKISTLFDTKDFKEIEQIDSYSFSKDEKKILIGIETESIFRHSTRAIYYAFDSVTKTLTLISKEKIQEPTFSPNGQKVAYVASNNLFVFDLNTKKTIQITNDGKKNNIINGVTDWVYEEEFAFVKAYDWSLNSDKIAFIKFDESEVPEFAMDVYGKDLYPTSEKIKYPKAGEKNATVSLHLFDLKNNSNKKIDLSNYSDFYIARMQWTKDPNTFCAQILNRHQDKLDLVFINGDSGESTVILTEKDPAYVDVTDNLTFLKNNNFIWTSERDGYNHIYYYDAKGTLINQVTKGNWEVTKYYGLEEESKKIYYQSVENGSINRDVYSISLDGKNKKRLSSQTGKNEASFSPKFDYYINTYSSANNAPTYTLNESNTGKQIKTIVSNETLENGLKSYDLPSKEFFEIKTSKGDLLNAWILKPKDFDPSKKYPVLMYQYSGPGSQQVNNEWNSHDDYWFMMLTQQGYIVACVDGRGTGYKGAAFKKCTQLNLGRLEVEDQIEAAKIIGKYNYVDQARIGIFGWSFGGFMASNCLFQAPSVFKMAIAVAPVTSWRYYDSIYTERYLHTPQENASGYDDNSPINHVKNLKGDFLLVHGSADDNVHVQNSMNMVEALVQANKPFDWAIYPDKNHGIYGGYTRLHLYTKMTNFIKEKL